jgi:tRNA A-37 threonylcarbamoyl transferase component Bud32
MVGGDGIRALFVASRSAVRGLLEPEGDADAGWRRAFDQEAQESNARIVCWAAGVLVPLHVLAMLAFALRPEPDPTRAAWVFWMTRIHALQAVTTTLAALVAWRRWPAPLWRVLGDVVGVVGLLGAAVMSANAQRAHPNLNVFIIAAISIAVILRVRPGVFGAALLAAAAIVLGGIARFPRDPAARLADVFALLGASSVALFGFFLARSMRARELVARRQVERLNTDLERRVAAQVSEIVGRAEEIVGLNTQLNEKVRARSRELSMALARLAKGHRSLERGAILGGRVTIEARIGQGAMGAVYRGRDRVIDRIVAVKVVHAGSATELDGLHRFLREAEALASVAHPAIVRSFHVDVAEDGQLFQVMELVEGETLDARLGRVGVLPPGVACRLGAVLADALAAAHAAGVVHRDVKPSNVMLTRAAPGLKLLDFGISKLRDAHPDGGRTEDRILGTPEFLSPEQVNDPHGVAAPADVYALGLILYLCLAGRMPFEPTSTRNWLIMHLVQPPTELAHHGPDLDATLVAMVMACLEKEPEARPTARDLAAKLLAIADGEGTPLLPDLALVRLGVASGVVVRSAETELSSMATKSLPAGDATLAGKARLGG